MMLIYANKTKQTKWIHKKQSYLFLATETLKQINVLKQSKTVSWDKIIFNYV